MVGLLVGCSRNEAPLAQSDSGGGGAALSSSSSSSEASSQAASSQPAQPAQPTGKLRLPILVYHHIRENEGWAPTTWSAKMSVSPANFEKHMQWLMHQGYTAITLDAAAAILTGTEPGPAKPVVITFDDNQPSQYEVALPILQKYHHVAVFYVVTNRLENPLTLNRERIVELAALGMDVQSHTVSHRVLTQLPNTEVDWELQQSKKELEEILGKPVRHIAYPGTAHNARVRERTRLAGYTTATIMDPRAAHENDDPMKLPRIMMTDDSDLARILP